MRTRDMRPQSFVAELRCDRCGLQARHNADIGFNNFLQIELDAGWGSALGDGVHVEIDLCHTCLQESLGPWLRMSVSAWAAGPEGDEHASR